MTEALPDTDPNGFLICLRVDYPYTGPLQSFYQLFQVLTSAVQTLIVPGIHKAHVTTSNARFTSLPEMVPRHIHAKARQRKSDRSYFLAECYFISKYGANSF